MITISRRRIAAAVAGPAVIAGVLSGALALGAPASAQPVTSQSACTTAKVVATAPSTSILTRAGQLNGTDDERQPVTATSCIGH